MPMLASKNTAGIRMLDGWHQACEWTLLVLVAIHVGAAFVIVFIYRDRIMLRMLMG
jgi:cytochrome b561